MISRRAVLLAGLTLAGCRPRLSIPNGDRSLAPLPEAAPHDGRLLAKARDFETAMLHHLTPEGVVLTERRVDPDPDDPLNSQDAAIWTGCYVAAEAYRWTATRDPAARERLDRCLGALHLLHDATGVPGVLARMVKRATGPAPGELATWRQGSGAWSAYRWMGDVSVDQYAGVFFGYAAAWDALDDPVRREAIAQRVAAMVDRLIAHHWRIVDADGRETRHSDLSGGVLTEPLNSLLALMFTKAAAVATGAPRFTGTYQDLLARGYARAALRARNPWWEYLFGVNHSDNNLAYLGLYPLTRLERDDRLLALYRRALQRAWGVVRAEGNPFFTFTTRAVETPGWHDAAADALAEDTLVRFPFPKRDETILNSANRDVCRAWFDDRHGAPQACRPVPIDQRPRSSFEWASNPYRMDRRGDPRTSLAGVDYLLAYWLGRRHGFLTDAQ